MNNLVDEREKLADLLAHEGRAIAISMPEQAYASARDFQSTMRDMGIDGHMYVAHKATDRTALVSRLVRDLEVGVDVASLGELETCLAAGIRPESIIVTGPKADRLLVRAVEAGVRAIVIDSLGELERLIALQAEAYPDVLLRLTRSVLNRPGVMRTGRFGLDMLAYKKALDMLLSTPAITLRGLHFHIDTRSVDEKSHAVNVALNLLAELSAQGFDSATVLDIGGGFGSSYGLSTADIDVFDTEIKRSLSDNSLDTYQKMSYGLKKMPDGRIAGELSGVDVPVFPVGSERLRAILATEKDGQTLATRASEMLIEIWCEPGRAIFSAAGAVVSEVIDVSERDGRVAIVTNIEHGQILFDGYEVLTDPILLPSEKTDDNEVRGYVFGHLCMESDIVSYRLVRFAQRPKPGDILLWTHTGGYRMHMSQTNAIMHPDMARYRYEDDQFIREEI